MEPLPAEQRYVDAFKAGDPAAFAKIMTHYESYVLGLLWRLTGDKAAAEDLCQETFLKVLKALPSFRRDSSLKTWIFRIAHNTATDHLRASGPVVEDLEEAERKGALPAAGSPSPMRQVEEGRLRQGIEKAMAALPRAQREILHMLYWDGLTVAEISAATAMPEGTVKTLLFRGRKALRDRVSSSLEEGLA